MFSHMYHKVFLQKWTMEDVVKPDPLAVVTGMAVVRAVLEDAHHRVADRHPSVLALDGSHATGCPSLFIAIDQ